MIACMGNVTHERFCPRLAGWPATWGPNERPTDRCAECNELVVYNPTVGEGPVRLVCIDCLHVGATLES